MHQSTIHDCWRCNIRTPAQQFVTWGMLGTVARELEWDSEQKKYTQVHHNYVPSSRMVWRVKPNTCSGQAGPQAAKEMLEEEEGDASDDLGVFVLLF